MAERKPPDLDLRFDHHPPPADFVGQAHAVWREECKAIATHALVHLPESRERSLAMTKLEEVMFWGNAAIARYYAEHEPPATTS